MPDSAQGAFLFVLGSIALIFSFVLLCSGVMTLGVGTIVMGLIGILASVLLMTISRENTDYKK